MPFFSKIRSLFRNLSPSPRGDSDLDAEVRAHLQLLIDEKMRAGMAADEAERHARIELGGIEQVKEQVRDRQIGVWFRSVLDDCRYALRQIRKNPGFTAVAVLTLALGIGANTAIFSLIDAVMLRSLPVENSSELLVLKWSARKEPKITGYASSGDCIMNLQPGAQNPSGCSFSEPMFREIAQKNVFAGVAAFANSGRLNLTGNGPASVLFGQLASGDFFRTLGVHPALGRVFQSSDDSPTAAPVAVLNYGYWQSEFGGARDVVGRTIELNGVPFTIIGVAEQRFTGLTPGSDFEVWLPLSVAPRLNNPARWRNRERDVTFWWLTIVGRAKPEVPLAQAQAAIALTFSNELLHGTVLIFEAGGNSPTPHGMPLGNIPIRREMALGGMPGPGAPGPAGPSLAGGPPRPQMSIAPVPPAGGPNGAKIQPPSSGAPNVALGNPAQAPPPEQKTLSGPGDEPSVSLVPAQTGLIGSRNRYANPLYLLMLAVGIILLIACANVAGLMLARSSARRKEMAVRLALGAGRPRIVRQLLTESLLLSFVGGALGILFAYWGAHLIVSFVSSNQLRPLGFSAGVDLRVLGFTVAISLLTGILFGLAPAFRSSRVDLTPALKEGLGDASGIAHARAKWLSVGNALVVTQLALAIVVLVGAGLLVRTLANLRGIDMGFNPRNIVIFGIDPSLAGYKDAQIDSFYRDLQSRLSETPGVLSASYSSMPLLSGFLMKTMFHWPGTPQDRNSEANVLNVGPNFFDAMQIPFLTGRNFTPPDFAIAAAGTYPAVSSVPTPVIVNQSFIVKYLGKENPIGKLFGESEGSDAEPKSAGYEIIGVVRDAKYNDLRQEISPTMYAPQSGSGASFEVRTAADPQAMLPAIREVVAQLNQNLPLFQVSTQSEQIDRLLFQERLVARLAGFFGLLALLLACIGLYGLLSYEVSRRTHEIGTRMALGAQVGDVLRLVVKQGFVLALVGVAIGIGVALGVTRYLKSMLYNLHANDPLTICAVAALLMLIALAACFIPARRASSVDPIIALRHE
jgi:predicted permease